MAILVLADGTNAIVDDADSPRIQEYSWWANKGVHTTYVQGKVNGELIYLHVWLVQPQKPYVVDHIDRNGLNNQRHNLRICTQSQNLAARGLQRNNTSGYRGVTYAKKCNKWQASIRVNRKSIFIGYYVTNEEAARAYDRYAKLIYKEFAYLNFPEEANGSQA